MRHSYTVSQVECQPQWPEPDLPRGVRPVWVGLGILALSAASSLALFAALMGLAGAL